MTSTSTQAKPWDQLIFIAGHPRGGTTWLGAVLSKADEANYIFEPQLTDKHPRTSQRDAVEAYNRLPRWYLSADDDLAEFRQALIDHLGELIQAYFERDRVDTLVIKIPETERLPWLLHSLGADRLIYSQRHPLGVINSYDKSRTYWAVQQRWDFMVADLAEHFPDLLPLTQGVGKGDVERAAAMIHLRYCLLERFADLPDSYIRPYEALAADPMAEYRKIFQWLGWSWDDALESRLQPLFRPKVEKEGFFETQKESSKRIEAWRRELAPWKIRRLARLYRKLGAEYPVPGHGFPPLSTSEKNSAVASFVKRRAKHAFRWVEGKVLGTGGA